MDVPLFFFNAIFDAVITIGVTDLHETKNNERPVSFKYKGTNGSSYDYEMSISCKYKGDEFKTTYEGFVYWVYNHIKYRNFSGKIFLTCPFLI